VSAVDFVTRKGLVISVVADPKDVSRDAKYYILEPMGLAAICCWIDRRKAKGKSAKVTSKVAQMFLKRGYMFKVER